MAPHFDISAAKLNLLASFISCALFQCIKHKQQQTATAVHLTWPCTIFINIASLSRVDRNCTSFNQLSREPKRSMIALRKSIIQQPCWGQVTSQKIATHTQYLLNYTYLTEKKTLLCRFICGLLSAIHHTLAHTRALTGYQFYF